jgi:hypothetical protein
MWQTGTLIHYPPSHLDALLQICASREFRSRLTRRKATQE